MARTSISPAKRLGAGAIAAAGAVTAATVGAGAASASTGTHTLRMTASQIKDVVINNVDIATDRDVQNGKTTGYDVTSCVMNFQTHTATCDVAVARRAGLLYGHITVNVSTGKGSGKVTGGTRGFKGATGTISSAAGSSPSAINVTIVYHF